MNNALNALLKWALAHLATPTVEQDIITFGIQELIANTKIPPAEVKTILQGVITAAQDGINGLPAGT